MFVVNGFAVEGILRTLTDTGASDSRDVGDTRGADGACQQDTNTAYDDISEGIRHRSFHVSFICETRFPKARNRRSAKMFYLFRLQINSACKK